MSLITTPNLTNQDKVYAQLIDAHKNLNQEQCASFDARLILILINHIGDENSISAAIEMARKHTE